MDYSSENKKIYDALALQYLQKVPEREEFSEVLLAKFIDHVKVGSTILDVGCSVGLDMATLITKGFKVVGVDISDEMAKFARERNKGSEIIVGNFLDIQFNEQFDGMVMHGFVHLFPKQTAVRTLEKAYDLLKKDGVIDITTNFSEESKEGWFVKSDYVGNHKRYRKFWTKKEIDSVFEEIGFSIVSYSEMDDPYGTRWMIFTLKK
jgi:cyclopropane fatty-acyl-phospholipid synthase-like methyltransferase